MKRQTETERERQLQGSRRVGGAVRQSGNESSTITLENEEAMKGETLVTAEAGEPVGELLNYHAMELGEIASVCDTDISTGLDAEKAKMKLERDGPNKMTEGKKRTIWQKIWDQIANVLVVILLVVAIISLIKGIQSSGEDQITSLIEVVLILGVIIMNTYIGVRQEGSAEKAADALKNMLSSNATVIRGNQKIEIDAQDLVIGDKVVLSLGDKIPADVRLTSVANLQCQEAALTGEAVPIEKHVQAILAKEGEGHSSIPLGDRKNLAFSATTVVQGSGEGIVICTGDDTEIGRINGMVQSEKSGKTNVEKQIDTVSLFIAGFVICIAIITFCVAFLYTGQEALNALSTALVTAVAMIPEGLAAIVTLTYGWAVKKMADENAIVRALPSVETLGSVTVICSDKTGTLTQNLMSMVAFVVSDGRFRVDVNASERKSTSMVRDDSYMTHKRGEPAARGAAGSFSNRSNGDAAAAVGPADGGVELSSIKVEGSTPDVAPAGQAVPEGCSPSTEMVKSMLATGILCSQAELAADGKREGSIGNPTEIAIMRAAFWSNVNHTEMRQKQKMIATVPFSSEYKFMATVHEADPAVDGKVDGLLVHVKGAVDRLMPLCVNQCVSGLVDKVEPVNQDYWLTAAENLASHGYRVLCLTRGTVPAGSVKEGDNLEREFVDGKGPWLTCVGLAAIQDPPRPECIESIRIAHRASVVVKMITGDHKATALAIGDELGIVDEKHPDGVTGPELDKMTDKELTVAVMENNIFARASPENKIRIVKALQSQGQVCSMTGDGVNDAPALKAADMGVAMGQEGTDVAREAAQMILADDNFSTIVTAVKEGRVVWDNLRKVLLFNTPVNNAQGLTVLVGMIAALPYPVLTPIQVLYCNLICAVTLGFVLAVEPAEDGIMDQPPRRPTKRLIGRYLLFRIAFASCLLVAFTVGAVFWVINSYAPDAPIPVFTEAQALLFPGCPDPKLTNSNGDPATEWCYYSNDCNPWNGECVNQEFICKNNPQVLSAGPERPFGAKVPTCANVVGRRVIRSQASNTLTLSAISVMLSARFAYQSGFHKRLLFGNKYAWYAALITLVLQICITYIPGLNSIVFQMGPMDGKQWGICILFVVLTFCCMEAEKAVMRYFKSKKMDTDDEGDGYVPPKEDITEPFVSTTSQRSAAMHTQLLHK